MKSAALAILVALVSVACGGGSDQPTNPAAPSPRVTEPFSGETVECIGADRVWVDPNTPSGRPLVYCDWAGETTLYYYNATACAYVGIATAWPNP